MNTESMIHDLMFLAVIALLHWRGIIVVEFWVPKWLSDSVPDLPDNGRFYG